VKLDRAVVTYQPAARVLDASAPKLQGLEAGDVLVIKGQIARKVVAVEPQPGGAVAVLTQSATIGEAVRQGHVRLDGVAGERWVPQRPHRTPCRPSRVKALLDRSTIDTRRVVA